MDTWAIGALAEGDAALRQRFTAALHNGADLLFSIGHGIEIGGAQGAPSVAIKIFLDELGPHWYPVESLVLNVVKRESEGAPPSQSCFAVDLLRAYFENRTSEYVPGSGRVIDLSGQFFRLGAFVDWLAPVRDTTLASCRELDTTLRDVISTLRAKAKRNQGWLDGVMPEPRFDPSMPATFAYSSLMRDLIADRGYQLKNGDGIDFSHSVMASAFADFATLDKQWKRRVENFPQPNKGTRFYYEPELGTMVNDIESALAQLKPSR